MMLTESNDDPKGQMVFKESNYAFSMYDHLFQQGSHFRHRTYHSYSLLAVSVTISTTGILLGCVTSKVRPFFKTETSVPDYNGSEQFLTHHDIITILASLMLASLSSNLSTFLLLTNIEIWFCCYSPPASVGNREMAAVQECVCP